MLWTSCLLYNYNTAVSQTLLISRTTRDCSLQVEPNGPGRRGPFVYTLRVTHVQGSIWKPLTTVPGSPSDGVNHYNEI